MPDPSIVLCSCCVALLLCCFVALLLCSRTVLTLHGVGDWEFVALPHANVCLAYFVLCVAPIRCCAFVVTVVPYQRFQLPSSLTLNRPST